MTDEEFLAAQLAGSTNAYMRNILKGGTGDEHNIVRQHNRTDWRQIVANRNQRFPQHQQFHDQYQPDMNHPAAAGDYGDLPGEVPINTTMLPMPRDAQGNIIGLPPNQQQMPEGLNIGGFQVPAYGAATAPKK